MKDILQDAKVDARVQTAPGVAVADETFVRAVVQLADAIASGNADKLEPMLTRRAKEALGLVKAGNGWASATKDLEVVRIVYAAAPTVMSDLERTQAIATLNAEFLNGTKLRESMMVRNGLTKEEIAKVEASVRADFQKDLARLNSKATMDAVLDGKPEFVVLMALQDPKGSYLLGWGGVRDGQSWQFNNASTMRIERPRASDWDSIGMLGFSIADGDLILPEVMPAGGAGKPGEKGKDGAPSSSPPGGSAPNFTIRTAISDRGL